MHYSSKERIGVHELGLALAREFNWIFREQTTSDVGIDGHIELVTGEAASGKLIAAQVKTGDSFLHKTSEGLVFYGDNKHLDYWLTHSLPVLVVVYSTSEEVLRWVDIRADNIERTTKRWKVVFPEKNLFNKASLDDLLSVFDRAPTGIGVNNISIISYKEWPGLESHVGSIVEDIANDLQIYKWYGWVEEACCAHIPALRESFVEGARSARVKLPSWIFPSDSSPEILLSASEMIHKANYAVDLLLERAEYENARYRGVHAYKRYHNPNFDRDNRDHIAWAKTFVACFKEFVKAANLFCDVVREQVEPSFLLKKGKLMFSDDFASWSEVPEYTVAERQDILRAGKLDRLSLMPLMPQLARADKSRINLRLMPKPVAEFNTFLDNAFGDGACVCIRCREGGGDEAGYKYQHTFDIGGVKKNRRFASSSSGDAYVYFKKAWLSYTKSEVPAGRVVSMDIIKEFVDPQLHELIIPLFLACGIIREVRGEFILQEAD